MLTLLKERFMRPLAAMRSPETVEAVEAEPETVAEPEPETGAFGLPPGPTRDMLMQRYAAESLKPRPVADQQRREEAVTRVRERIATARAVDRLDATMAATTVAKGAPDCLRDELAAPE